jgi:hypothetical protein
LNLKKKTNILYTRVHITKLNFTRRVSYKCGRNVCVIPISSGYSNMFFFLPTFQRRVILNQMLKCEKICSGYSIHSHTAQALNILVKKTKTKLWRNNFFREYFTISTDFTHLLLCRRCSGCVSRYRWSIMRPLAQWMRRAASMGMF